METLFWIGVFGVMYSYVAYPLILFIFPRRRVAPTVEFDVPPSVSIIIAAHNEEARIEEKLDNTLQVKYSVAPIETIVASDASTDSTDHIVLRYRKKGIRLVRSDERKGKEHAQSLAIGESSGQIIVFTDVSTKIPADSISNIVKRFMDEKVGAVSSEDRFIGRDGAIVGEGLYVRYEMWLRRLESNVNSLVGLSGSFFAARRNLCKRWDVESPSDFNIAMNCIREGYVAVSDSSVIGYYRDVLNDTQEYSRKVRTILRGVSALVRQYDMLNLRQYGLFAWQMWSHKVMRWLVPWFLAGLLLSSIILASSGALYFSVAVAQAGFYLAALAALASQSLRTHVLFRIPFFFTQANVAIAHATVMFALGRRVLSWEPSRR
jgi:cellulose synthase/poly-beta-1,6-N-acetylglucosamine synthase-like glycosyltransferase